MIKKIIITIVAIPVLMVLVLIVNYIIFVNIASQISQGTPIVKTDSIKLAVLVIDIQEGTTGSVSGFDYYINKSEELINKINQIADTSASKNIPVIYIKNEITNFLLNILNDLYAKGTPGAELDSRLKPVSEFIINKNKSDAFSNSTLDSILIKSGVNKLVFTGLDLAHCVNSTISAAVNRKYDICIISDAVLAKSDSLKKVKLTEFKQTGFEVLPSNEYFESIIRNKKLSSI